MTPLVRKYVPPVTGLVLITLFVSLAFWQIERAAEKSALLDSFNGDAPYASDVNFESLANFARIEVDGRFLGDRQVLIDNIAHNSRQGYYVITPFRTDTSKRYLLVNRGWIPKDGVEGGAPFIDVDASLRTVRGLVGHLPAAGFRPGEPFEGSTGWPRVSVYPTLDEIAAEIGATVFPVVLLMSPGEDDGFTRRWQPNTRGPMMHYGYTFQWFAMAAAVFVILFRHLRKGRGRDRTTR